MYSLYAKSKSADQQFIHIVFIFYQRKSGQSKKDSKDQKLIQPSTIPDPGYQMGK